MNFDVILTAREAWFFLPLALPICLWAVYTDIKEFRISNYAVLGLLATFVVLGPFALGFSEYLWRFSHFAVVLAIGFGLWALFGIGAGDAKIAAAIAPFVALSDVSVVMLIWILAMVFMVVLYSRSFVREAQTVGFREARKMEVPFGIALAPTLAIYLILGVTQGGV